MINYSKAIHDGAETAFVNKEHLSDAAYKPQFLFNDFNNGIKILSALEQELNRCDDFIISVAFITMGGITPLLQTLRELKAAGKKGKILTTDYLTFSEPKALDKLSEFDNIELKMFSTGDDAVGFHTKGYIFRKDELYTVIVGSSNITRDALTRNKEWNSRIVSTQNGEYITNLLTEFEVLWNAENTKYYTEVKETYKTRFDIVQRQKETAKNTPIADNTEEILQPNTMQVNFVKNFLSLRQNGEKKGLLISATGTGKTYASAFALREAGVKKVLFIVHREQIAKQALDSFRQVFGKTVSMGLLSGNSKCFDADYLFATMQTVSKEEILTQFRQTEFDTIVIDEVHRAGAGSYRKIMAYFTPEFWLGMTATPERSDGFDIYALFDHNIAYEIRLQKAMEEDMLCPFHYFGISDLEVDGQVFDDKTNISNFRLLVSEERVEHVISQIHYYGYSGNRPKGLIFCSRLEEAQELSRKFNERGFRTVALRGSDGQEQREDCIDRLTNDFRKDYLDYIFTVDIFNEGVDIPDINQIIMLRPTESQIIFVQQLGRGLRKAANKEYVVILDFIGNYTNNFMIPMALSGDKSYSKDTIRRYVREGNRVIPGSSTIHFDEISRKRIYASIDKVSTTKKLLTEKYLEYRYKLGRIPTLCEFYRDSEIDPLLFLDYAGSYHGFLTGITKDEPEYKVKFEVPETNVLEFFSSLLAKGKRPHELLLVKMLAERSACTRTELISGLAEYGLQRPDESIDSAIRFLKGEFVNTQGEKARYRSLGLLEETADGVSVGERLQKFLANPALKEQLEDVIQLGLMRFEDIYRKEMDSAGFALYQKYSRKDVCHLLNWEHDDSATMYGYRIKYNTCPIFVTYDKKEDVSASTNYADEFVTSSVFSWMTRNRVTLASDEAQAIIHSRENHTKIMLFVKKSDDEGADFYYMGQVRPIEWNETTIPDKNGKRLPIVNFRFEMEKAVRADIYDYITA